MYSREKLQALFTEHLPLAAASGIYIQSLTPELIELRAPFARNCNHHGSAFGGSIAVLGIACGWAAAQWVLDDAQLAGALVIKSSNCDYRAPLRGDLCAQSTIYLQDAATFVLQFLAQGKAQLNIQSRIYATDNLATVCAVHNGCYVALAPQP